MKNNNEKKSMILGVAFLGWFLASIAAMLYFSSVNSLFGIAIFGQVFLVMGLFAFFSKDNIKSKDMEKYFPLIFVVVGFLCIVIPLLMAQPDLIPIKFNWDLMIPLLMLFGFLLVGVGIIVFPLINRKGKLKRCTYSIKSKIKSYKTTRGDSSTLYCPVYEFYYNNQIYEVDENYYSNVGIKPIDTEVNLLINPNRPKEFVLKNKSVDLISLIIGISFIVSSLAIIILILTGNSSLT